jgi:hypothetical protein
MLAPLLAHYLGLRGLAAGMVPVAGVTILLAVTYVLLRRSFPKRLSFPMLLLLGTTQGFITSQTWIGYQDSFGHLAIALCLLSRRPPLAIPVLFLGMMGEERCAAAVPLVVLWHFATSQEQRWRQAMLWTASCIVAVGLWCAAFQWIHGTLVPLESRQSFTWNEVISVKWFGLYLNDLPMGYFESIRCGWIFPILLLGLWTRQKQWLLVSGYAIAIMLCLLQAGLVGDISRSSSVVWPAVFIAAHFLYRDNPEKFATTLRFALLLNLLTPCYQIMGKLIQLYWPLPFSLLRLLLQK